jgi:hypothetical protein
MPPASRGNHPDPKPPSLTPSATSLSPAARSPPFPFILLLARPKSSGHVELAGIFEYMQSQMPSQLSAGDFLEQPTSCGSVPEPQLDAEIDRARSALPLCQEPLLSRCPESSTRMPGSADLLDWERSRGESGQTSVRSGQIRAGRSSVPFQRSAAVVKRDSLQPGKPVAAGALWARFCRRGSATGR